MSVQALSHTNLETSTSLRLPAIAREVEEQLGRSSYRALRDVTCVASDGVLYLHSCLPSHYLKQVAQEVAWNARGVRHVINRIIVPTPERRAQPGRGTFTNPSI